KLLELPDLPLAGDIVDWIEAHGDAAEPDGMREEIEALADKAELLRATKPAGAVCRDEPFPPDALPEPLRGFVASGGQATGCDTPYLVLRMLTMRAAAIGNARRIQLKRGWTAPPILWCAIVGESGTAKTPAFKLALRAFRERQRKALERHSEAMLNYDADEA